MGRNEKAMTHDFPLFIGYTTLEAWMEAIDPSRPVFACKITEPGENSTYVQETRIVIMIAQPDESDLVHYCRLPVGHVKIFFGESFGKEHQQQVELAEQAWKLVYKWLKGKGLPMRQGVVATPANLRMVDGQAGCLHFDNQEQRYVVASVG
jgi:hypothetical protein